MALRKQSRHRVKALFNRPSRLVERYTRLGVNAALPELRGKVKRTA